MFAMIKSKLQLVLSVAFVNVYVFTYIYTYMLSFLHNDTRFSD